MNKLFNIAAILIFILLSSSTIASDSSQSKPITWHEWSNETFALAEAENKLVLLDISAEWCSFCKKMKAITYKDPEVIKIINENYIAIKADIETTLDVKMLYGNFGVPGTVVLTAQRDELNKRLGYIAPQQMQWHLLGSLQDMPAPDKLTSLQTTKSQ